MAETYDAIVVGSGLVGGWAAKTLVDRGLKVLLLEAGEEKQPAQPGKGEPGTINDVWDRTKAALRGQYIQARGNNFNPEVEHLYVNDRRNPYVTPWNRPFLWFRGRQVGGRGHTWGRMCLRMSPMDFAQSSRDGVGHDWPITYDDLKPFYDHIEDTLGLEGEAEGHEGVPDGRYIAGRSMNELETAFAQTVQSRWSERRFINPRVVSLYVSPRSYTIDEALKTGRLTLRPSSIAYRVECDSGEKLADRVVYIDRETKQEHTAKAPVIFLCASTIETLRILWNSKSPTHAGSLGNEKDLLGRHVMDNNAVLFTGMVDAPAESSSQESSAIYDLGRVHGFYMPRYQNLGDEQDAPFKRGFGIQGGIGRGTSAWYLFAFGEMLPDPKNRITVHHRRRDAWGIPSAYINVTQGENDWVMVKKMETDLKEMIDAEGLKITESPAKGFFMKLLFKGLLRSVMCRPGVFHPGGAIHETGGAPMGSSPDFSVVNQHNQVWECPNVFVTDGACFTTSSHLNPTHTMMAITVRAAEYAANWLADGRPMP